MGVNRKCKLFCCSSARRNLLCWARRPQKNFLSPAPTVAAANCLARLAAYPSALLSPAPCGPVSLSPRGIRLQLPPPRLPGQPARPLQ